MFYKKDIEGYKEVIPGVKLKTLSYGDKTLLSEFLIEQGNSLPKHHHPCEQTGYLISGSMLLTIGNETFEVTPGDSWAIKSNVLHSTAAVKDSVVIEVFSPVREEYLPENLA
ncbi:MAG: cupin domain-containing protein [Spirochaetales bacterium]|nr:cupin domain-containing protein [Spirochaetales bacterium]